VTDTTPEMPCLCRGMESYIMVDTLSEYSGVTLVCLICQREIPVADINGNGIDLRSGKP
jgi:hypothetical protein